MYNLKKYFKNDELIFHELPYDCYKKPKVAIYKGLDDVILNDELMIERFNAILIDDSDNIIAIVNNMQYIDEDQSLIDISNISDIKEEDIYEAKDYDYDEDDHYIISDFNIKYHDMVYINYFRSLAMNNITEIREDINNFIDSLPIIGYRDRLKLKIDLSINFKNANEDDYKQFPDIMRLLIRSDEDNYKRFKHLIKTDKPGYYLEFSSSNHKYKDFMNQFDNMQFYKPEDIQYLLNKYSDHNMKEGNLNAF